MIASWMLYTLALGTLLALMALWFSLAGCSSTEYLISTKQGQVLTAQGKPEIDSKSGMYVYQDSEGRKAAIHKDNVLTVIER